MTSVVANSGDGDDTVTVDGTGTAAPLPVTLNGGDGGGDAFVLDVAAPGVTAAVYGGDGNDTVYADADDAFTAYDGEGGSNTFERLRHPRPVRPGLDGRGRRLHNDGTKALAMQGGFLTNVQTIIADGSLNTITGTAGPDTITYPDADGGSQDVSGKRRRGRYQHLRRRDRQRPPPATDPVLTSRSSRLNPSR